MCQPEQKHNRSTVEDLERAAWFARLAFGNPGEIEGSIPVREPRRSSFEVLP